MRPRNRWANGLAAAGLAWLAVVGRGFFLLGAHSATPGIAGDPPVRWPADSRIVPDPGRANLVVVAHPRCPCTRATIAELGRLLARCDGAVTAHILFLRPRGTAAAWTETDLWRAAAAIRGTRVYADLEGRDAARFGAATSGHALLYDASGVLRYSGGMTGSRGHEGDNPGRAAITALLIRGYAERGRMPVYGCPLFQAAPLEDP